MKTQLIKKSIEHVCACLKGHVGIDDLKMIICAYAIEPVEQYCIQLNQSAAGVSLNLVEWDVMDIPAIVTRVPSIRKAQMRIPFPLPNTISKDVNIGDIIKTMRMLVPLQFRPYSGYEVTFHRRFLFDMIRKTKWELLEDWSFDYLIFPGYTCTFPWKS